MRRLNIEIARGLSGVDPSEWDALAGGDDPFTEHAFLLALEASGSVGAESGWVPCHVLVRERGALVGVMPLYLKTNSYGEYIFDWGWAAAAHRAGLRYYPKLTSAVPFTPATGRRLLTGDGLDHEVAGALARGAREVAEASGASSLHVLFCTEAERDALAAAHGLMPRLTYQFHWTNRGYASFEDYLAAMRAPSRKQVRRERRRAAELGLDLNVLTGPELDLRHWRALRAFYLDTARRKGAIPYLTGAFFERLRCALSHRVVAAFASRDGAPVAASLAFTKGRNLYGRYWGCAERWECLHFELCYYQLIAWCIARGLRHFEAGAQGEHKLKRGLLPRPTFSAHWVRHPALAEAVGRYLPEEATATRREMAWLADHGPFRRDAGGAGGLR